MLLLPTLRWLSSYVVQEWAKLLEVADCFKRGCNRTSKPSFYLPKRPGTFRQALAKQSEIGVIYLI